MSLQWTDELSVGYGIIDEQHKELFSRYNKLILACKEGKGREKIGPMLDFMVAYVTEHFAEEEGFMQRYNFPEQAEHLQQHKELFAQVNEVYQELQNNGATVAVVTAINHTIFNWLIKHVKQTDIKLGRYLAAQAA